MQVFYLRHKHLTISFVLHNTRLLIVGKTIMALSRAKEAYDQIKLLFINQKLKYDECRRIIQDDE